MFRLDKIIIMCELRTVSEPRTLPRIILWARLSLRILPARFENVAMGRGWNLPEKLGCKQTQSRSSSWS